MPWSAVHGFRFTSASILTNVPKQSGVFGLYNEQGWVFIGQGSDLQQSLFQCLDKSRQYFWPNEPHGYTFEICNSDACNERRDALILEYYPTRNHLPVSTGDQTRLRQFR